MSAVFAPWVGGSNAVDFSETIHHGRYPHLRIVPSAPECEDNDYEIEENDALNQNDYEGILMLVIKALSVLILFLCIACIGLGLGFALRGNPAEAIIVQSGDSLYSIGERVPNAPSAAQAVDDIRSLNALGSDTVHAGQRLILPEY